MKRFYTTLTLILIIFLACGQSSNEILQETEYIDTGVDENQWVRIPAGKFLKGQHEHETLIDYDYEIMITDVTNRQYAVYLNEAMEEGVIQIIENKVVGPYPGDPFDGHKHEFEIPAGNKIHIILDEPGLRIRFDGETFTVVPGFENHPIVMVTWFGAKAYADFYGLRLPTENEWEKAARGHDNRAYPWGDEIARNQANYYSSHHLFDKLFDGHTITTPVGFYNGKKYGDYQTGDGRSPFGLYDMAGNVWQWTGDDYHDMHYRYMRGGSQANYEYNLRVWTRNSAGPDHYGMNIGFRCVMDVAGQKEAKSTQSMRVHISH